MTNRDDLDAALEWADKPVHHRDCDDPWYSCPLSPDGCADERQEGCTCGAERNKQMRDTLAAAVRQLEAENAALRLENVDLLIRHKDCQPHCQYEVLTAERDALRADLARLTAAVTTYCSDAAKAYLQPRDVVALAEAHAEDSQTVDKLEADLARARAVLDTAIDNDLGSVGWRKLYVNEPAWQAWQAWQAREGA